MATYTKTMKRDYIFAAWHGRCAYCDRKAEALDHVIPQVAWRRDGSLSVHGWQNLVPACVWCNTRKGDRSLDDFLGYAPERCQRIRAYLAVHREALLRRLDAEDQRRLRNRMALREQAA
jgi:HNH endonuclease